MTQSELEVKYKELNSKHRLRRWSDLIISFLLILIALVIVWTDYLSSNLDVGPATTIAVLIASLGISQLRETQKNWASTEALGLLKEIVNNR